MENAKQRRQRKRALERSGNADAAAGAAAQTARTSEIAAKKRIAGVRNDCVGTLDKLSEKGGVKSLLAVESMEDPRVPDCFREYFFRNGLTQPFKVQGLVWPLILDGRDVLALAPTGSGKTIAYLLPALAHVLACKTSPGFRVIPGSPVVVVVVPTRELAVQVLGVAKKFRRPFGVRCASAYGGKDRAMQVELLQDVDGVDVLIATPGRALDLLGTADVSFAQVSMLVLDEADRMLDLGFEPQIAGLAERLVVRAQNVLMSATFPRKLRMILAKLKLMVNRPVSVRVQSGDAGAIQVVDGMPGNDHAASMNDSQDETNSDKDNKNKQSKEDKAKERWEKNREGNVALLGADGSHADGISANIKQIVQVCAEHKKPRKLIRFIDKIREADKKCGARNQSAVLVFCTRIKVVKFVGTFLRERQNLKNTAVLHGGLDQKTREKTMRDFKAGKTKILVATDVAGRGIDIKGLPYVINYDFPASLQAYAHRIGRTGRQTASGTAFSFFTRNFAPMAADLVALLRKCDQPVDSYLLQLVDTKDSANVGISEEAQADDKGDKTGNNNISSDAVHSPKRKLQKTKKLGIAAVASKTN